MVAAGNVSFFAQQNPFFLLSLRPNTLGGENFPTLKIRYESIK